MSSSKIQLYGYLDANSFQKIFPQEYMKKFASHLKVLQFQKKMFQNPPSPGKLKFTKRSNSSQNIKLERVIPKTNLSKFAKINDTLIHDKAQIVRFKRIAKQITENVNNHQIKSKLLKQKFSNEIKTIHNKEEVQMKIIDNMLVQSTRQTNQKINQKLQKLKNKQVFCKFIQRDSEKQGKNSYKTQLQWPSMKKYNSEKQMKSFSQKQQDFEVSKKLQHKSNSLHQFLKPKQSILSNPNFNRTISQQNKSKNRSLTSPFNLLKKNRLKSTSKFVGAQKVYEKKDLIQETKKLKSDKNKLKSILYSKEVGKKDWQEVVQNILQKKSPNSLHSHGFSTTRY